MIYSDFIAMKTRVFFREMPSQTFFVIGRFNAICFRRGENVVFVCLFLAQKSVFGRVTVACSAGIRSHCLSFKYLFKKIYITLWIVRGYGILSTNLWCVRDQTSESRERVSSGWQANDHVNTVQSTFHAVACLFYTYWYFLLRKGSLIGLIELAYSS